MLQAAHYAPSPILVEIGLGRSDYREEAQLTRLPPYRAYIEREITIFMTSFDPPKIRVTRLSRYMRAIG